MFAKPAAEPTKTGAALAIRNFGLEARKRISSFEFLRVDSIYLILALDYRYCT